VSVVRVDGAPEDEVGGRLAQYTCCGAKKLCAERN
jgi:hypothetical protein